MKLTAFAKTAAFALLTLAGMTASRPARADQSAVNLLAPYLKWARTRPEGGGTYCLQVVMVSNTPRRVASYVQATLPYYEQATTRPPRRIAGFSGDADQYFSDRQWAPPDSLIGYPFSPYETDRVKVDIDALNGVLYLTLESWGNTRLQADLHAQNGMLIGTIPGSTPTTVILSLREYYISPI